MPTPDARTLHIPAVQWPVVITDYLVEHGSPAQVVPAQVAPVDADEVLWGTSIIELRCIKITILADAEERDILHNPNFPDS